MRLPPTSWFSLSQLAVLGHPGSDGRTRRNAACLAVRFAAFVGPNGVAKPAARSGSIATVRNKVLLFNYRPLATRHGRASQYPARRRTRQQEHLAGHLRLELRL